MKPITLGALASVAVLSAGTAIARQNVDFSKVEIRTTDLGNKTYMLQGQGGNITVAVGTDGIIMVDSEFAPLHDKIKAAIEKISPLPIKYLIDTHYHGDHTGGNAPFHRGGAIVVAQDNIRTRVAAGTTNGLTGNKTSPVAVDALPTETYVGGSKTVEVGGRKAVLNHVYMRIPTGTPGSISWMPTCSIRVIPSRIAAAITPSISLMVVTSGA
jgi:cyclase